MSNWVEDLKQDNRDAEKYMRDLERREEKLLNAVRDLSQQYGIKKPGDSDHCVAMARLAGDILVDISRMPRSRKPILRTY